MNAKSTFLKSYLSSFESIEGMFSPDAAVLFMAYNRLIRSGGIEGDALEIGVHHGLSAIGVAALRGTGRRFVAVDLFEDLQSFNLSRSGSGQRQRFLSNMARFYPDTSFVTTIAAPSSTLSPSDLGSGFSFCHIDGGHSSTETYGDLDLCSRISLPGGLIAIDDYFNPSFPGVCEGAVRFMLERPGELQPVAIGFNKVLFQKMPVPFDLNRAFDDAYPLVANSESEFWNTPVHHFAAGLRLFFDLDNSTPDGLIPSSGLELAAEIRSTPSINTRPDAKVELPVTVRNCSAIAFDTGSAPFGLSYHLLSKQGEMLRYDNQRRYFHRALPPGETETMQLALEAPGQPGSYLAEIDIVWEGIAWLKERGSRTALVKIEVG